MEVRDTRTPEQIARDAIQDLLSRKLIEQGLLKQFYLELSEIVKRFLGQKLNILSLERTTEEFTRDLRKTSLPATGFWDDSRILSRSAIWSSSLNTIPARKRFKAFLNRRFN